MREDILIIQKEFIEYKELLNMKKAGIEVLRVIAIALVIFHHIDITYLFYHNTNNIGTFIISLFITTIVTIDVPIFFTISGYLLLSKEESIKNVWQNRIIRMALVLVLFSIAQFIVQVLCNNKEWSFILFWKMLIQGEIQETYWFLYAYIGFLIFLPLLRKFVKNFSLSDYEYLLLITFFFECIKLLNVVTGITINSGIMSFISSVCNYTFYAISGYVIEQNCEMLYSDKKYIKHATITSVALVLMPMFIISFLYYAKGEYADWAIGMFNQFLTISVFYIILYLCHIYKQKILINSISKLGKFVFAMFLVEQFSRHILLNLYLYLISNTIGIFAAFVYWFTTFILSFILAVIMKYIPGVKRLL